MLKWCSLEVINNRTSVKSTHIFLVTDVQVGSLIVEMEDVEVLVDSLGHVDLLNVIKHEVVI